MDSQVRAQLGEHIDRLGRIGNFSEGGYWRQPFSAADREAKELLTQWMAAAGMSVRQDNAGNLFGRLEGRDGGKVIMTGSHLDSVKSGGGLDGALLDVNLGGIYSWPVAEALAARRIPFALLTGFGAGLDVPAAFAAIPRLAKPIEIRALARALSAF